MMRTDPDDPYRKLYDYDDERTVFTLADWYHTPSEEIIASHSVLKTWVHTVLWPPALTPI
jgi:hypothetical protein